MRREKETVEPVLQCHLCHEAGEPSLDGLCKKHFARRYSHVCTTQQKDDFQFHTPFQKFILKVTSPIRSILAKLKR